MSIPISFSSVQILRAYRRKIVVTPPPDDCPFPWTNQYRHPDAFWYEDFGQSYATEAAWQSALSSRYATVGVSTFGTLAFDSTRLFNGGAYALKVADDTTSVFEGTLLFNDDAGVGGTTGLQRLWYRWWVYMDTSSPGSFTFGPQPFMDDGDFPTFLGFIVSNFNGDGSEGWANLAYSDHPTEYSPRSYAPATLEGMGGRWVCVAALAEIVTLNVEGRLRIWVDGTKMIDATTTDTTHQFDPVHSSSYFTGARLPVQRRDDSPDPSAILSVGLMELIDYEVNGDPYCLLSAEDDTAPTVIYVSPADGANDVSRSGDIIIGFSEAMDASTLTSTNIILSQAGTPVTCVVTQNSASSARINPTPTLGSQLVYDIEVTTGVMDEAGNAMASSFTSSFTTTL